jgi:hypothetical protein
MHRLILRLGSLILVLAAAVSTVPRTEAAQVCNLLCIQGYHCCVQHGSPTCVPESQPC